MHYFGIVESKNYFGMVFEHRCFDMIAQSSHWDMVMVRCFVTAEPAICFDTREGVGKVNCLGTIEDINYFDIADHKNCLEIVETGIGFDTDVGKGNYFDVVDKVNCFDFVDEVNCYDSVEEVNDFDIAGKEHDFDIVGKVNDFDIVEKGKKDFETVDRVNYHSIEKSDCFGMAEEGDCFVEDEALKTETLVEIDQSSRNNLNIHQVFQSTDCKKHLMHIFSIVHSWCHLKVY